MKIYSHAEVPKIDKNIMFLSKGSAIHLRWIIVCGQHGYTGLSLARNNKLVNGELAIVRTNSQHLSNYWLLGLQSEDGDWPFDLEDITHTEEHGNWNVV